MRRLITFIAAILIAAVAAVAALPLLLSPERASAEIAGRLAALTGYDVVIGGDTELRLFPSLRFAINDVRLRSESGEELAEAQSLTGTVALLPLLTGRVEIDGFALTGPRFNLEIDPAGRSNWTLSDSALIGAAVSRPEQLPAREVTIGDIRIDNGSMRYVDHRSGQHHEIENIRATVSWATLADPLAFRGALDWAGDRVEFDVTAERPVAFINRGSSAVRLSITSNLANASFSGNAHLTDDVQMSGRLSLSTPSARGLLYRLGTDLGAGSGLEALELYGHVNFLGETAVISELRMTLDGNRAEGSMKVDMEQERIGVQGTLAFDRLDLNRYRRQPEEETAAISGPPQDPLSTPIDLSDLHRTVADIRISAHSIKAGTLVLGETAGTITVRDGVLTLGIAEAALHGGLAMGTVTASQGASGVIARIGLTLDRISTREFLSLVAGVDRISGTGSANATLSAQGRTLNEIMDGLAGEARIMVTEGAVRGIDLPAAIEAVRAGRLDGWPAGDGAQTPFGEITGTFQLARGIANTQDFRLHNPSFIVHMAGDIRLAAATVSGTGTAELGAEQGGPAMPFVIEGPLARPAIYPDPRWLLDQAAGRHRDELGRIGERIEELRTNERVDELIREGIQRLPGIFGTQ